MAKNELLNLAKANKNDEFYTQLSDIENEMRHYKKHFKGKVVFCNCDDPFESNFFKYFVLNFKRLGLKKLIATCYTGSPIAGKQLSLFDVLGDEGKRNTPYKAIVTDVYDITGDGGIDMFDVAELFRQGTNTLEELQGNGDFRSQECLALMDEADIVATNPPFSLFREYVACLMERNKKFIIMGNKNAITYKVFFPLLMNNEVWVGATSLNGGRWMIMPESIDVKSTKAKINERGEVVVNVPGVCWFTNLDIKKRHEPMILVKRYDPDKYPHYNNYDAIDVESLEDIPCDYSGTMGVPITLMDKYDPSQFKIIGYGKGYLAQSIGVTKNHRGRTDLEYTKPDGRYKCPYGRILVKNLQPEQPKQKD